MAFEYEFMGKKVRLELDEDFVAVRFSEPALHSTRSSVASASGLGQFHKRIEIPGEKFTIMPVAQTAESRSVRHASAMKSLQAKNEVKRVAPVFKMGQRTIVATDRILVGFKYKATKFKNLLKTLGCEIVEVRDKECLIRLPEDACPFDISKKLLAMKDVEYAEPDFVTLGRHVSLRAPNPNGNTTGPNPMATSGDPLLPQQYAPKITKAVEAWSLQIGDPSVVIAILDEGVDSNHEDLKSAIVGTYDGVDDDTFQEPNPWDAHGTACSGLAAGVPNNNTGVRGIGGGCGLMAIRIAYSESEASGWVTSNSWAVRSIDWAWKNGASVLSNSWGGGAPSTAIANAF